MLDVPLGCADRKIIPRSLQLVVEPRRREARPPPCRSCCGPAWWNGWRVTYPVVASSADSVARRELPPARSAPAAASVSRAIRRAFYPRWEYQLDVVANAVAAVALGGSPSRRRLPRVRRA